VRPPKSASLEDPKVLRIVTFKDIEDESVFVQNLKSAKASSSKVTMIKLAKDYIASDQFVASPNKIDPRYIQLAYAIRDHASQPVDTFFAESYEKAFSVKASELIDTPEFKSTTIRVCNSLIATFIMPIVSGETSSLILYLVYAVSFIRELAGNSLGSQQILDARINIPSGILPVPSSEQSLLEQRKNELEKKRKASQEIKKKIGKSVHLLNSNKSAIGEIVGTFEKVDVGRMSNNPGFRLSKETSANISSATKDVLKNNGIEISEIDVAKSVTLLEKSNAAVANELYRNMNQGRTVMKLGSVLVPADHVSPDSGAGVWGQDDTLMTLGTCPPANLGVNPDGDGSPTIPTSVGQARILGIADLMIVEQKLSRYELGEIAHIENVLKTESRKRELRNSKTTEETVVSETETTETKEKDLATTDRYELQTESQNVITDNASMDAGLTINEHGPSVDVSSNMDVANSTSTQESHQTASTFGREITARATNRIEQRQLQRRTMRTKEETVEINKHDFDNTGADAENISGIYRWVNKIYEAQVVNYGKRFTLEFIVPEPAAFLRFAAAQIPNEGEPSFEKPDPPGYCLSDGKTFQPLRVQDVTPESYMYWVGKYNVEDVNPPPSSILIVSASIANPGSDMKELVAIKESILSEGLKWVLQCMQKDIEIPEGYVPYQANINMGGQQRNTEAKLTVQIQDQEVSNQTIGSWGSVSLANKNTASIPVTIDSLDFLIYEVIINIMCTLSVEKYQEWQLATYKAIVNSYNDKKSRYDGAIQAQKVAASYNPIQGKNPLLNRETEKIELKRGCISLMTGQRFNDFDAMNTNIAPYGYPEIDFVEAQAEGEYIRFFEQALEWTNMMYLFYPYFWSNKKEWVVLSKLDDVDPLYARFLQAGSARVQVPIRPGFERSLLQYLSKTSIIWKGAATFQVDDGDPDIFSLSMVDELKSQMGNNEVEGKGTLNLVNGAISVTGTDTEFSSSDENRRLIIKEKTYVIKKVQDSLNISLSTPYLEDSDPEARYALGGVLVGQPWEITLPTDLIKLDSSIQIG